jgi:hypothetical protein
MAAEAGSTKVHTNQFHEIMRDAEVANAIGPIVRKHRLGVEEAAGLLRKCGVARAQNVAQIATSSWLAIAASGL